MLGGLDSGVEVLLDGAVVGVEGAGGAGFEIASQAADGFDPIFRKIGEVAGVCSNGAIFWIDHCRCISLMTEARAMEMAASDSEDSPMRMCWHLSRFATRWVAAPKWFKAWMACMGWST